MCDECHVISLTVVKNVTFSWGCFIFLGHRAPIRSGNTSNMAYINPQAGIVLLSASPPAQRIGKHLTSQKLETDHAKDWVFTRGEMDSSQSYKASHIVSVCHVKRKPVLESRFVLDRDNQFEYVIAHYWLPYGTSSLSYRNYPKCWKVCTIVTKYVHSSFVTLKDSFLTFTLQLCKHVLTTVLWSSVCLSWFLSFAYLSHLHVYLVILDKE